MLPETTIPDASAIAEEAFVLAYPLVLMSRAMAQATAVVAPEPETLRAPVNTLVHGRDTPDTLRSSAWLDLAAEPIVLPAPDTCGRYYVLWLHDAWDNVFASIGARTTGTAAGAFAIVGPRSRGVPLPRGLTPIAAPTRIVRVTGCIEAVGETDDEALSRAHDSFGLVPLSRWPDARAPANPSSLAPDDPGSPVAQVERMDARAFFSELSRLVADNPPDPAGCAVLDRLREVGASDALGPQVWDSLERGVQRGRAAVQAESERERRELVGQWRVCFEPRLDGADPLRRAGAVRAASPAEPAADALHAFLDSDSGGRPLSGRCRYQLRFAPDAPPPVHGFWSLATHAGTVGGVHAIGDLRGLTIDRDGSLPIHIQYPRPARERKSNWLPAPLDGFSLALHLYWPREEALERHWSPPPVTRVD